MASTYPTVGSNPAWQKSWLDALAKAKQAPAPTTYGPDATVGSNPAWQQQWVNAYSAINPTWTPPADANAALPQPIQPVTFNPELDPSYTGAEGIYGYTDKDPTGADVYHPGTLVKHAQNQADYQGHQIGQSYGYDAQGNVITSGADLNPYAQAAILKRNYDNSVRGTTNSYASQGQLYSGALKNAQGSNDFSYGQSSDASKRAAQGAYNSAASGVTNAQDQSIAQLAALLGPAYANFLASQRGS